MRAIKSQPPERTVTFQGNTSYYKVSSFSRAAAFYPPLCAKHFIYTLKYNFILKHKIICPCCSNKALRFTLNN